MDGNFIELITSHDSSLFLLSWMINSTSNTHIIDNTFGGVKHLSSVLFQNKKNEREDAPYYSLCIFIFSLSSSLFSGVESPVTQALGGFVPSSSSGLRFANIHVLCFLLISFEFVHHLVLKRSCVSYPEREKHKASAVRLIEYRVGVSSFLLRGRIPSQIWNYSESEDMAEHEDFKGPIIQTWILKIHCSCKGCKKKVKKVLLNIDGVHTVNIDAAEQKVTVTGNVASANVLLEKLLASGKRAELWPVAQNEHQKEAKTQKQPEHAAMAQNKQEKESKIQKQPEHAAVAQNEKDNKKPKTPKQPEEKKSVRHGDNGQVEKDALFTERQVVFKMETLVAATNNFHDDNKLGEGGFGPVYKGTTHDGKQIAVKKLVSTSKQGRKEFLNEKLLAKIQHRNIVNLLGCCKEGSQMFVVYEYLPNGSLHKFLSDAEKRKDLDWQKRYNIILGIARALRYLHEDSQLRIVHRDIKASNILLDEKLNPKIADFGTAKVFPEDDTHVSTGVVGTPGYMAPEYFMGEQLSVNVDVYSFGILLLELVTGKKISSEKGIEWVWSSYKGREIESTIDPAIIETRDKEKVLRCIHVGLLCTQADSLRRPPMSEVTAMLSNPVTLPVPTKPPGCNVRRRKVNPLDGAM